jgi:hypothetical protein
LVVVEGITALGCACAVCALCRSAPRNRASLDKFGYRPPLNTRGRIMNLKARREFIEGLRAVAKFYEDNPDAFYDGIHLTINMYVAGSAARPVLGQTAKIFGNCNKVYSDTQVTLSRQFSKQVSLAVFAPRAAVCRPLAWCCDPLLDPEHKGKLER